MSIYWNMSYGPRILYRLVKIKKKKKKIKKSTKFIRQTNKYGAPLNSRGINTKSTSLHDSLDPITETRQD